VRVQFNLDLCIIDRFPNQQLVRVQSARVPLAAAGAVADGVVAVGVAVAGVSVLTLAVRVVLSRDKSWNEVFNGLVDHFREKSDEVFGFVIPLVRRVVRVCQNCAEI